MRITWEELKNAEMSLEFPLDKSWLNYLESPYHTSWFLHPTNGTGRWKFQASAFISTWIFAWRFFPSVQMTSQFLNSIYVAYVRSYCILCCQWISWRVRTANTYSSNYKIHCALDIAWSMQSLILQKCLKPVTVLKKILLQLEFTPTPMINFPP